MCVCACVCVTKVCVYVCFALKILKFEILTLCLYLKNLTQTRNTLKVVFVLGGLLGLAPKTRSEYISQ